MNRTYCRIACLLVALTLGTAPAALGQTAKAPATPVIFDTDLGNDVDDALAMAILHALESRGEIRLVGITITKDNVWAPRLASAIDTHYGRPSIPIGMVKNGQTKDDGYLKKALDAGHYRYSDKTEDAVTLLQRLLKAEPDGSVVVIQVGFSTNLARLLDAPGGRELVAKKVKLLSVMGGNFVGGEAEYNIKIDAPAAQKLVREWPTRVYFSPYELGETIKYPAESIERDFGPVGASPVADAYRQYMKMPYDRETWDLTSVLYALRPDAGYFHVSQPGTVDIDTQGNTKFTPAADGKHYVLSVTELQRMRILETFRWLCTQPAQCR